MTPTWLRRLGAVATRELSGLCRVAEIAAGGVGEMARAANMSRTETDGEGTIVDTSGTQRTATGGHGQPALRIAQRNACSLHLCSMRAVLRRLAPLGSGPDPGGWGAAVEDAVG